MLEYSIVPSLSYQLLGQRSFSCLCLEEIAVWSLALSDFDYYQLLVFSLLIDKFLPYNEVKAIAVYHAFLNLQVSHGLFLSSLSGCRPYCCHYYS